MKNRTLAILALVLTILSSVSAVRYSQLNFSVSDAFSSWEVCNKTLGATGNLLWQLLPIICIVLFFALSLTLSILVLLRSKKEHGEGKLLVKLAIFILGFIVFLLYFGVLTPQYLMPERCEVQQSFYCKEHKVVDLPGSGIDFIKFSFQNGRGQDIMIERFAAQGMGDINSTYCDTGDYLTTLSWNGKAGLHIANGDLANIVVPCGPNTLDGLPGTAKKKYALNIIWYNADSDATSNKTMNGQLLEKVTRCS